MRQEFIQKVQALVGQSEGHTWQLRNGQDQLAAESKVTNNILMKYSGQTVANTSYHGHGPYSKLEPQQQAAVDMYMMDNKITDRGSVNPTRDIIASKHAKVEEITKHHTDQTQSRFAMEYLSAKHDISFLANLNFRDDLKHSTDLPLIGQTARHDQALPGKGGGGGKGHA